MGLFDNDTALWGPTISQDPANFPQEFVDPRSLPPLQPATAAPATAAPAQPGTDWGKVIQGVAGAGLAGMAAGQGDYTFGLRMQQMMQQGEQRKKQAARQEEAAKMEKERLLSTKFNHFFGFLKDFDADEETTTKAGQAFIKANPDIAEYLKDGGIDPANIKLGKRGEEITFENYELSGKEGIIDPISKEPLKGKYNLKGQFVDGQFKATQMNKIDKTTSELAKIDQKDYTKESFAKYLQTKNRTDLEPIAKAADSPAVGIDREATAQEMGYKSFAEAPTEVKVKINKDVKRFEEARLKLSQTRVTVEAGKSDFNQASQLRTQYLQQAKTFQDVRDSFSRVEASAKNPSPAGDLSMIFAYMRMLDPGSVVRESEFRVAAIARPALERVGLSWDRVQSVWEGKQLTTGQRNDYLQRARGLYSQQEKFYAQTKGEFGRIAESAGINPRDVIVELTSPGESAPAQTNQPQATMRYNPTTGKLEPIK